MMDPQRPQPGAATPGAPGEPAGRQANSDAQEGGVLRDEPGAASTNAAGDVSAQRVAALEAELAEMKDRYLRAVAETENVRKRGREEVSKANKFGIESFAEALLPVRDSLELAIKSDAPTVENIREGVETTLRLLGGVFERNGLRDIDPAGQKFDPNLHQAISTVPLDAANPKLPPNHVANVLQKGYLINDRVLRPALVTVTQG